MKPTDQEFLEYVVKMLVDHPEDVHVTRQVDEMGVLLTLDVHAADMGKVIGRSGNTAKAIRILLRVVGMKNNARVNLKVNEPEGGRVSSADTSYAPAAPRMQGELSEATKRIDDELADLKL